MTLTPALPSLLALLLVTTTTTLPAQTRQDDVHRPIRTTDRRLHRLVHEGVRTSDTFRGLVERLSLSDLVVYLECDAPFGHPGGRLTFVSAVGGHRYVRVRVALLTSADRQIAIIGHELRHAVEIAEAPEVIDGPSLAREYDRIGYVNPRTVTAGVTFDSDAAVQTGYQVLRELWGVSGD